MAYPSASVPISTRLLVGAETLNGDLAAASPPFLRSRDRLSTTLRPATGLIASLFP